MKASLLASLAAVLILGTGPALAGSAVLGSDMTAYQGPGEQYRPVLRLVAGQSIDIFECNFEQWCRVAHKGVEGWVHARLGPAGPSMPQPGAGGKGGGGKGGGSQSADASGGGAATGGGGPSGSAAAGLTDRYRSSLGSGGADSGGGSSGLTDRYRASLGGGGGGSGDLTSPSPIPGTLTPAPGTNTRF